MTSISIAFLRILFVLSTNSLVNELVKLNLLIFHLLKLILEHSHSSNLFGTKSLLVLKCCLLCIQLVIKFSKNIIELKFKCTWYSLLLCRVLFLASFILIKHSLLQFLLVFSYFLVKSSLKIWDLIQNLSLESINLTIPVVSLYWI